MIYNSAKNLQLLIFTASWYSSDITVQLKTWLTKVKKQQSHSVIPTLSHHALRLLTAQVYLQNAVFTANWNSQAILKMYIL